MMRVVLASRYRFWMLVLLPVTLGLGTALLWLRSLRWPSAIDDGGITLRDWRKVPWQAIDKIHVRKTYYGDRVTRLDIYHRSGGIDRIPICALQNGQTIAGTIVAAFKQNLSETR